MILDLLFCKSNFLENLFKSRRSYLKLIRYKLIKGVIWTSKQRGAGIPQFEGSNSRTIEDLERLIQGYIQLCLEQLQEDLKVERVPISLLCTDLQLKYYALESLFFHILMTTTRIW